MLLIFDHYESCILIKYKYQPLNVQDNSSKNYKQPLKTYIINYKFKHQTINVFIRTV